MHEPPLANAIRATGMSWDELWIAYVGLGGTLARPELVAQYAAGQLPDPQRSVMEQVLNDWFTERGMDHPVPDRID